LQAMGFQVIPLPARVLKHHSEGDIPPKTHILLQVLIGEDKFLVDVGFGKETLTGPIPFKMDNGIATLIWRLFYAAIGCKLINSFSISFGVKYPNEECLLSLL